MPFLDPAVSAALRTKMCNDKAQLGKLYKVKTSRFHVRSVDVSLVDQMIADGWEEFGDPGKTRVRLRKLKPHHVLFEDDIWCQLYRLGYRHMNIDASMHLPFGQSELDRKQIDVVAIDSDSVILVECKSSAEPGRAASLKSDMDLLKERLDGFRKSIDESFGPGRRIKYILATRNIRLSRDSVDIKRLVDAGGFFFNENTYNYIESLIRTYKSASHYQFKGILFRGQNINKNRIEVPAIEGTMGGKTYYMFSIEPSILLKIGFVLHRTQANEAETPTYQRLLIPSRIKGIEKFIDGGGYFPNSAIINFNQKTTKIEFQGGAKTKDSASRTGLLKIPNCYASAYIIDGQHRIYGYAGSKYRSTNTIPVVAFVDLAPSEQLELFMQINENQKAVSPTLRITLESDLNWNSARLDSRMKALSSSIVLSLGADPGGPLHGKISLGEDRGTLQAKPFSEALRRSGLLPTAKGNQFLEGTVLGSLYNVANVSFQEEMDNSRGRVVSFINECYQLAEERLGAVDSALGRFILTNRGSFAFICLIGDLNKYVTGINGLSATTDLEIRIEYMRPYLEALFDALDKISEDDAKSLSSSLGSGADVAWLRTFQHFVNTSCPDYCPVELQDWLERQDKALQDQARDIATEIERYMKGVVISQLKALFKLDWELEIAPIKRKCEERASEQMERDYREGLKRVDIPWTDQFQIMDYKSIIEKYWTKKPEGQDVRSFEDIFSIDAGFGMGSKAERLKWIVVFNKHRNTLAHAGSKEKGLNKEDVENLRIWRDKLGIPSV